MPILYVNLLPVKHLCSLIYFKLPMNGKHKGNKNLYTDQRDEELYRAFSKAKKTLLNDVGFIRLNDVIELTRHSPASRYFVSEQRASEVIKVINAQASGCRNFRSFCQLPVFIRMRHQSRRMYFCLYIEYLEQKKLHSDESHDEIVTRACAAPASEFFLSHKATIDLLSRIRINKSRLGVISSSLSLINNYKGK